MYGDLAWVEANYGCVAEYNRCKWEEEYDYEPTEEEIAESERQLAEYNAEIKRLDGEPSDFIKALVAEWEALEPKRYEGDDMIEYNKSVIEGHKWFDKRKRDILEKVGKHYGVDINGDHNDFYHIPDDVFAISVEYNDGCFIEHAIIGNLDLPTFKNVFRDLHYARLYPTMSHKGRYISNVSLGHLLRNYIHE